MIYNIERVWAVEFILKMGNRYNNIIPTKILNCNDTDKNKFLNEIDYSLISYSRDDLNNSFYWMSKEKDKLDKMLLHEILEYGEKLNIWVLNEKQRRLDFK